MRKTASKSTVWLLSLILCATLIFTGCTQKTKVYCDTDTLRIERTGTVTTIYDLAGADSYTFRTVRVRNGSQAAEAAAEYKTVNDTETIKIDVVKGVIIVEDKTAGLIYTIE